MKNPEADVHIGLFAREMLLKFARQEPGNVQQVINTLESTRMTMMDNGFASNPIDLKDKSGNKIFSIVVGHKNKITLSIQPDGPVRYGEEQIWFEKNLIPEAIWIQIEAESKKSAKAVGLRAMDRDRSRRLCRRTSRHEARNYQSRNFKRKRISRDLDESENHTLPECHGRTRGNKVCLRNLPDGSVQDARAINQTGGKIMGQRSKVKNPKFIWSSYWNTWSLLLTESCEATPGHGRFVEIVLSAGDSDYAVQQLRRLSVDRHDNERGRKDRYADQLPPEVASKIVDTLGDDVGSFIQNNDPHEILEMIDFVKLATRADPSFYNVVKDEMRNKLPKAKTGQYHPA